MTTHIDIAQGWHREALAAATTAKAYTWSGSHDGLVRIIERHAPVPSYGNPAAAQCKYCRDRCHSLDGSSCEKPFDGVWPCRDVVDAVQAARRIRHHWWVRRMLTGWRRGRWKVKDR